MAEVRELEVGVLLVERDTSARLRTPSPGRAGEVAVEAVLELAQQHVELLAPGGPGRRPPPTAPTVVAATPRAARATSSNSASVPGVPAAPARRHTPSVRSPSARVPRAEAYAVLPVIASSSSATSRTDRAIGPGASWLRGERHDALGAQRPTVGLRPTHAVERARAGDRAVGLGADRERRESGRQRGARPRRRAARAAVERPRVAGEPADPRPAAGRVRRAHVGPLGQVRGAEHDELPPRAASATSGESLSTTRPASASDPAVPGSPTASMLSFTSTGIPCSGPRSVPGGALGVERLRLVEGVGAHREDGPQLRSRRRRPRRCGRAARGSARPTSYARRRGRRRARRRSRSRGRPWRGAGRGTRRQRRRASGPLTTGGWPEVLTRVLGRRHDRPAGRGAGRKDRRTHEPAQARRLAPGRARTGRRRHRRALRAAGLRHAPAPTAAQHVRGPALLPHQRHPDLLRRRDPVQPARPRPLGPQPVLRRLLRRVGRRAPARLHARRTSPTSSSTAARTSTTGCCSTPRCAPT